MQEGQEDREPFGRRETDAAAARSGGSLARLSELDNYRVADGNADIRGWVVRTQDGRTVGRVDELIVDTAALRARYMEVRLDREFAGGDQQRWALVPIGTAQLDDEGDEVIVDRVPVAGFLTKEERAREPLSRETELSLRELYGATSTGLAADAALESDEDFYGDALYDDQRMRRGLRSDGGSDPYITEGGDIQHRF